MARVWRQGQKKKVWIYRLLTTGSIEEKVRVWSVHTGRERRCTQHARIASVYACH